MTPTPPEVSVTSNDAPSAALPTSLPTSPRSAYQPAGAGIFQRMSALAVEHGSVNYAQGIPDAVYDDLWQTQLSQAATGATFQYTPSAGLPALREVVAAEHGVAPEHVVITSGCTESLAAGIQACAFRGATKVVWTEPYYSFYPGMAAQAGLAAQCVPMRKTGAKYEFDLVALEQALAGPELTVALVNSPHNPTGAVLPDSAWAELVAIAERTNSVLLVDDAYRDFHFTEASTPYADLVATGRVVVAGSISKSAAAAGMRVGWAIGSVELLAWVDDAHMHMSYCSPAPIQVATAGVLQRIWNRSANPQPASTVARWYAERRDLLVAALRDAGCFPTVPDGGFFVTTSWPEALSNGCTDGESLARYLTVEHGITPLPLDVFYAKPPAVPVLRFSVTVSDEDTERGCAALRRLASV